jgi:hypothetical protein
MNYVFKVINWRDKALEDVKDVTFLACTAKFSFYYLTKLVPFKRKLIFLQLVSLTKLKICI